MRIEKTIKVMPETKKRFDQHQRELAANLKLGHQLSKRFGIPFVHGDTSRRLEVLRESEVTVVSRAGDEGVSLTDVQRVIEIDFLYGSRR